MPPKRKALADVDANKADDTGSKKAKKVGKETTTKPKAPPKPRASAKPKAAPKPKAPPKSRASAKPKAAPKPKAPAKPRAARKPKASAVLTPTQLYNLLNSSRWSAVSGSANLDASYKLQMENKEYAYTWLTTCPPSFQRDDDDACGSKPCMCGKTPTDHASHPYVMSRAGMRLHSIQYAMADLRDPDNFQMYTFNDHAAYGIIEVVENLMASYFFARVVEEHEWHERWAIVEATALFLLSSCGQQMMMADDYKRIVDLSHVVGFMALDMLDTLEKAGLVKDASEVYNLGYIMALYIKITCVPEEEALSDSDSAARASDDFPADPSAVGDYIYAYAVKHNVALKGVKGIGALTAGLNKDIAMPEPDDDTWCWFHLYGLYNLSNMIGPGDELDITAWSSANRKAHSFDGRDPLPKKIMDDIKKGLVMTLA